MNFFAKKVVHLFFLISLFQLIHLHAESEIQMRSMDSRLQKLEQNSNNQPMEPITPNAGPRVPGGLDMFLSVDFLYWQARLDSLSYAKSGLFNPSTLSTTPPVNTLKGKVKDLDWKWDPGFKGCIGWTFCPSGFDLLLQYTWYYTATQTHTHAQNLHLSFPVLFSSGLIDGRMQSAKAKWHFHYQKGDIEIGRNYHVHKKLKLRPHIGFTGTWQTQNFVADYLSTQGQPTNNNPFNLQTKFDQDLWGIGMRAGLNTTVQFGNGFGLFGNFALSGVWIHYNTERKDSFSPTTPPNQPPTRGVYLNGSPHCLKPLFEFGIGFRLSHYFCDAGFHALIEVGWEGQIWPNQTLYISLDDNYDRFDLSLQGFVAKFRLDF
ncbi:MAG: hypothetical protein HYZ47_01755 [Simkania negevensis]|nr:hypothetical protein [Simkania negevensis]